MGTRVSRQDVKVSHFFFKQVSYKNSGQSIAVSRPMLHKEDNKEWVDLYLQSKQMQHQFLLLPESHEVESFKKFWACCECPADFQMLIVFENFEHLYTDQLLNRRKEEQYYSQEDLFIIMYNFSAALKEFQVNGRKFGDIRPAQIVLTSKEKLKMVNTASFPWELTALQKITENFDNTTRFYLAPQEINVLNKKLALNGFNTSKAEAFSLGMTLLEAALLQNSQEIYGLNPRTLDSKRLEKRLKTVAKEYPQFGYYLGLLLKINPLERYSAGELWSILKKYSERILQKHKFSRNERKQAAALQQFRKKSRA